MRGYATHLKKADKTAADDVPISKALGRLTGLIGSLDTLDLRLRVAASLTLTILAKLFVVGAPLLLADAINDLTGAGDWTGAFLALVLVWSAVRFAGSAAPQLRDAIFQPVSQEAQRRAGVAVFAHVQGLSLRFHQSKRTGAVWRTIERGVRGIDFLIRFMAFNIGPTIFELCLAAILLAWKYGLTFSLVAIATVAIYTVVTLTITEWRVRHRREMNEADTEATARAVDSLMNFETVKAFAAEDRETANYDKAVRSYAAASVKSNTSLQGLNAAQGLIQNLGLVAMILLAGRAVSGQEMGPGDVTAVLLVMMNLYAPLNILGFAWREIKQCAIDMEAMFALLDERPDVADRPGAMPLVLSGGHVRFEAVSFAHEARVAGLTDVSFEIPPGRTVAIVGPSGSGKSTLVRLLFRFYDPQSGRITIDGQDIATHTQQSLREAIGLVPQDVVLFNQTLRANIAYGRPGAGDDEIAEAASLARLDALIAGAPAGLDTMVGERGLKVSGGERQRVGIARAILKNPAILVLDEATSSLDSVTEAEVREALEDAARGRTTLVVAHRLSTIANADEILVLSDGRIAERGTHADLLELDGIYAGLWQRQSEQAG
jgi:ATP-binding cassette subfamily B protein